MDKHLKFHKRTSYEKISLRGDEEIFQEELVLLGQRKQDHIMIVSQTLASIQTNQQPKT
jgi:hypothetical protein